MIEAGDKVIICPEWCDCVAEETTEYLVVDGEEKGKSRITIQYNDLNLVIKPTQVIDVSMVKTVIKAK